MNSLNSILLEGSLVRDPEYTTTPKGTPVATFTIASNRYYREETELKKEENFFSVEAWGKLADHVNDFMHKGRGVRIVGRLKQDRFTDSEGKQRAKIFIVAEHIEIKPEITRVHTLETEHEDIKR